MRALREIARSCERHNTPLQLCGELAGDPISAFGLLGIGYRAISMAPSSIGPVKEMIRSLDMGEVTELVNDAVDDRIGKWTLNEVFRDYADQHGIAF